MTIRLYNTLTRGKELFTPLDNKNVRLYVCGPTVYDFAHIGNARPLIVFDVLYRLLRQIYGELHVRYVRNITDVDDKINARAAERGITIRELTEETNRGLPRRRRGARMLPPDVSRARPNISTEMMAIIERLIKSGHAYVADGHVLFDVRSMKDYGHLSGRPLDEMHGRRAGRSRALQARCRWISCCGNRQKRKSRAGIAPGAAAGPAGISNARR